jgi:hypothetical protein
MDREEKSKEQAPEADRHYNGRHTLITSDDLIPDEEMRRRYAK